MPSFTASKADRRRVAALGTAHRTRADPLAPGLELVGGGGPEGVRRAEDDGLAVGDEDPGELAGGRGLAGAVDPDDHDDARPRRRPAPASVCTVRSSVGADEVRAAPRAAGPQLARGCGCRAP